MFATEVVMKTKVGMFEVSTVLTPETGTTYETCIFGTENSEVVASFIKTRKEAIAAHKKWVDHVTNNGFVFDREDDDDDYEMQVELDPDK